MIRYLAPLAALSLIAAPAMAAPVQHPAKTVHKTTKRVKKAPAAKTAMVKTTSTTTTKTK